MIAVPAMRWSGLSRWGVVIAVAAACACSRRPLHTHSEPTKPTKPVTVLPQRPSIYLATNRNVDLLFLVDDSSSMTKSQDNLLRNFPVLMKALDGSSHFRRAEAAGTVRGRSWALHDGVIDGLWGGAGVGSVKMYRAAGRPAGIATFPDAPY